MPQTILVNDFSAGWIPSDDPITGRKNGFSDIQNLELEQNGAVRLTGGSLRLAPAYQDTVRDLYVTYMNMLRTDYAGDKAGNIYRNRAVIATGGSVDASNKFARTCFADAFDFTLICSGAVRIKDNGTSTVPLGLTTPSGPVVGTFEILSTQHLENQQWQIVGGVTYSGPVANYLNPTINNTTVTYESTGDMSAVLGFIPDYSNFFDTLPPVPITGVGPTDSDIYYFTFARQVGSLLDISRITIEFLLDQPNGTGSVSNFYRYVYDRALPDTNIATFNVTTGSLNIPRGSFEKFGASTKNWSTVYGFRTTITTTANVQFTMQWSTTVGFQGGDVPLRYGYDDYQWAQIYVAKNGSYVGKSMPSAPLAPYSHTNLANGLARLTPNLGGITADVNEIWVFRRGGGLDQYYRVMVIKPPVTQVNGYPDLVTDEEALFENIILNTDLVSVATLTEDILSIVGPMEGRWFYFTNNFIYPSEINNPDLVDIGKAIRINGSNSELFLWAAKVAVATIMVATTKDIYVLSGTFQTYPDFSIDIYYRPLGIKHPPVIRQVAIYNGICYSLASDGWRMYDSSGGDVNLVIPNTDILYSGITSSNSSFIPGQAPGTYFYPCAIDGEKFYAIVFERVEVYHIARKYWATLHYEGFTSASVLASIPGGGMTAVLNVDKIQRDFDRRSNLLLNNTDKQSFFYITPAFDNGQPANNKDPLTFKWHGNLGVAGDVVTFGVITEGGFSTPIGTVSFTGTTPALHILNANIIPSSRFYRFTVNGVAANFVQEWMSLDYEAHPAQLTHLIIRPSNFGISSEKRVRAWPFIIDALGNSVTFTPNVDNVPITPDTFNHNYKKTYVYKFIEDAFGTDYGGVFHGGPFEYWGEDASEINGVSGLAGPPTIVETLPQGVRFDQVGPEELARYGKIMQFDLRLLSRGTPLPWKLYFNDNTMATGELECRVNEQWSYNISMPKGVSGHIVRIELGPANYDFHRYYIRILCARSGGDTQNEWIALGGKKR